MKSSAHVRLVTMTLVAIWTSLSADCTRASGHDTLAGGIGGRSSVLVPARQPSSAGPSSPPADARSGASSGPIVDVLEYATMRLGWRSHLADVHRDDDFAIEQAAFLGRDLGITSLLRSRTSVAFANVFEPVEVGACILESSRSPFRVAWTSIAPWR